jgi:lysophospholipase L1-like esterase
MSSTRNKIEKLILLGLVPIFFILYLSKTSGVVFFIVLSLILISSLFFVKHLGAFSVYFQRKKFFLNNLLLAVTSLMLSLIAIESFLWIYQSKPETKQKLVMPQEWKKRRVSIPGASYAYYWHNILHVHDKNGMRRTTPFPPKLDGRFRIMIVGDSFTYGYGVREEETYPMQIESALNENFNVEVLNLGVIGYQSEDVLKIVRKYVPLLQPDLIIYGVCINDFLPHGTGTYRNNMAYQFPFTKVIKNFLSKRTNLGRLIRDTYNSVLMRLGLRNDFYEDILKDFKNYQVRFARDVRDMNHFVLNRGLPPIVAMVLDQYPELHSKGYQVAMAAERHLTNAGMTVIPTEEFYKKYDKQVMVVSPWEIHPNAKAHKIFADFFVNHLKNRKELEKYRITRITK